MRQESQHRFFEIWMKCGRQFFVCFIGHFFITRNNADHGRAEQSPCWPEKREKHQFPSHVLLSTKIVDATSHVKCFHAGLSPRRKPLYQNYSKKYVAHRSPFYFRTIERLLVEGTYACNFVTWKNFWSETLCCTKNNLFHLVASIIALAKIWTCVCTRFVNVNVNAWTRCGEPVLGTGGEPRPTIFTNLYLQIASR